MPLDKQLFGTTRPLPLTRERGWGGVTTQFLADVADWLEKSGYLSGGVALRRDLSAVASLSGGATLTPSAPVMVVSGAGGTPITLSATEPVAQGAIDGQILTLVGGSTTGTVRLRPGAKCSLNGSCLLEAGQALVLRWNAGSARWDEISRNN